MFADTPVTKKRKAVEMQKDHSGGSGAQTSEAKVVPKPKRKKPSSRRSTLNRNLETDDSSYRDEPTTSSRGQTQSSMLLRVEYLSSGCHTEGYLGEVS